MGMNVRILCVCVVLFMAIEAMGVPIATPMGRSLCNFLLVTVTLSLVIYFLVWNNNKNKEITSQIGQPSAQDKPTDYAIKNSTQDKFEFLAFKHQNMMNLNSWPDTTKIQ